MAVASIIKYEGDNSIFIWKLPIEDFKTGSQVQYRDPTYQFPLQIGASGEMMVSVTDSKNYL